MLLIVSSYLRGVSTIYLLIIIEYTRDRGRGRRKYLIYSRRIGAALS